MTWRASASTRVVTRGEIDAMNESERAAFFEHAWQFAPDKFYVDDPDVDTSLLMNHSCDPNTWFSSDAEMVARRDIAVDEEVTFDYATCESSNDAFTMRCMCKSAQCRGTVCGDDFRLPELRQRYANHRLSYLDALLANESSSTSSSSTSS